MADVCLPQRAKDGVADRVHQCVGIGMTFQSLEVWDLNASQNQPPPFHQRMHVVAYANMDHARNYRSGLPSGPSNLFFAGHARVERDGE